MCLRPIKISKELLKKERIRICIWAELWGNILFDQLYQYKYTYGIIYVYMHVGIKIIYNTFDNIYLINIPYI